VIFPAIASPWHISAASFSGVPKEMEEAARMDGCSELGLWWHVMLPGYSTSTQAMFVFNGSWSDFSGLCPRQTRVVHPAPRSRYTSWDFLPRLLIAAGSVISFAPVLLLFLFLQRYIVPTETGSGVKG